MDSQPVADIRRFRALPPTEPHLGEFCGELRQLCGADAVQILRPGDAAAIRIAGSEPSPEIAANLLKTAASAFNASGPYAEHTFRFSGQLVHFLATRLATGDWLAVWARLANDRAAAALRQLVLFAADSAPGGIATGSDLHRLAEASTPAVRRDHIAAWLADLLGAEACFLGLRRWRGWRIAEAFPRRPETRSELTQVLHQALRGSDTAPFLSEVAKLTGQPSARLVEIDPSTKLVLSGHPAALDGGDLTAARGLLHLAHPARARAHGDSRKRRRLWIAAGIALLVLLCIPFPDRIAVTAILQPKVVRNVAAPFNARVADVLVRRGDRVVANDIVISLDEREIVERTSEAQSRLAGAKLQTASDLEASNHSAAAIHSLEVESLTHELGVLEQQAALLKLRAPVAGVVLAGELEKVKGAAVEIGKPLLEIAALDPLVAELGVPDTDVSLVSAGQKVEVQLDAFPNQRLRSTVESVQPRAATRDAHNVFIAEAGVPNERGLLRPGMKGRAVIIAQAKPLGWLLLRKPVRLVRTWLFR